MGTPKSIEVVDALIRESDWLEYEEKGTGRYSRENCTVELDQDLNSGSVLMYNVAGTRVMAFDGARPVCGILVNRCKTDAVNTSPNTMVVRQARVAPTKLSWNAGLSDVNKTAGFTTLLSKGITTVREA